jgi:glyoxylase-like metal-dependent hydrolase (beta-lactamase superfamily II)
VITSDPHPVSTDALTDAPFFLTGVDSSALFRYYHFMSLDDAVQPPDWAAALPRPWYRGREKRSTGQPWFDVYPLFPGDYALYEGGHFQEVISFLILGRDRGLLWDTGMGIGDIRALAEELTNLPLTVLNSHTHFDHMGSNWRFDRVGVFAHPVALKRAAGGLPREQVAEHMTAEQFARPLPPGFFPDQYEIRGVPVTPVREGELFDLGGRTLEVLHTPGHSPDSIMLLDRDNSILFTGDTFYPAVLYAHLDSGGGMVSDFAVYRRTMSFLALHFGGLKTLRCSHNEPELPGQKLQAAAAAFEAIAENRAPYDADSQGRRLYRFEGFSIVTNPPGV